LLKNENDNVVISDTNINQNNNNKSDNNSDEKQKNTEEKINLQNSKQNNQDVMFDDNDALQITKVINHEIEKFKTEILIITDKMNDKIKTL